MTQRIAVILAIAALTWAGSPTVGQTPSSAPESKDGDTIWVAEPRGEAESDRASVQAAFDAVEPGDTVLFAAGTYLLGVGGRLTVPDVTVLGHPDGTVLRGCEPERFDLPEESTLDAVGAIAMGCTGFWVMADRQTIRGLTFDHTWHGLHIGHPLFERDSEEPLSPGFGGHRIEGNVFRNVPNGIRIVGPTDGVTVIRDNDVLNAYHAFQSTGATVYILGNRITVPTPEAVPTSNYPESAVILNPAPVPGACRGSRVIGNVVDGTVHGIQVRAGAYGTCEDLIIRDNVVTVRPVPLPSGYPRYLRDFYFGEGVGGTEVSGIGIRLDGSVGGSECAPGTATITRVLIRDNRILSGAGIGIQVVGASENRIVGNTISGIRVRAPFPGLTWGDDPQCWREANGSGIWVSPGSDENQIIGNTFEDVEGPAVFLEGDRNQVITRSPADVVRDVGNGNSVTVRTGGR